MVKGRIGVYLVILKLVHFPEHFPVEGIQTHYRGSGKVDDHRSARCSIFA